MAVLGLRMGSTTMTAWVMTSRLDSPIPVRFPDGEEIIRTAYYEDPSGRSAYGVAALHWQRDAPENAVASFVKRVFSTDQLTEGDRTAAGHIGKLARIAQESAEHEVGEPVSQIILVLPAYATEFSKGAFMEALAASGLRVSLTIPEPLATLYGYDADGEDKRVALSIRVGGSGCDVAVLSRHSPWAIDSIGGGRDCGGDHVDRLLADWFVSQMERQGIVVSGDAPVRRDMLQAAERAKREMSSHHTASMTVQVERGHFGEATLQQSEFRRLTEPVIYEIVNYVDDVIRHSRLSPHDVDSLMLSGGGTLLHGLREALEDRFGIPIESRVHPIMAAARGAALIGSQLESSPNEEVTSAESTRITVGRSSPPPDDSHAEATLPPVKRSQPSGLGQADAAPVKPVVLDENVQFTAYCPTQVLPEKAYTVLLFAHLDAVHPDAPPDASHPVQEVKETAARILGDQLNEYRPSTYESRHAVPREGELTFLLEIDGFRCNPPRQSLFWEEPVHRVEFRIKAPGSLEGKTCRGRLTVFLGDILLADLTLRIVVTSEPEHPTAAQTQVQQARPYRKIFASYSRRDLSVVEQFERFVGTLGDRYIRDLIDLRSGEQFNDALKRMIDEADVFQLFWSTSSMVSPYVRDEWEYALSLNRVDFIRPTYWEQPRPEQPPTLPPPELDRLHFQLLGRFVDHRPSAAPAVSQPIDLGTPTRDSVPAETTLRPGQANAPRPDSLSTQQERQRLYEDERQRQHERQEDLNRIGQGLIDAYHRFDVQEALYLHRQWEKLVQAAPPHPASYLVESIQPALAWLAHLERQRRDDNAFFASLAELESLLDRRGSLQDIERCYQKARSYDRGIPEQLQARIAEQRSAIELKQSRTRTLRLAVGATSLLVMVVATWLFVEQRQTRSREIAMHVAQLETLLLVDNTAEMRKYLDELKRSSPKTYESPAIREFEHQLDAPQNPTPVTPVKRESISRFLVAELIKVAKESPLLFIVVLAYAFVASLLGVNWGIHFLNSKYPRKQTSSVPQDPEDFFRSGPVDGSKGGTDFDAQRGAQPSEDYWI